MFKSIFPKPIFFIGALAMLIAIFVSSESLIAFLRAGTATDPLLTGATIFRAMLGILGAAICALALVPFWKITSLDSSPVRDQLSAAILAALLIVATALRLYALDAGLWLDEIITNVLYARLPFGTIITTFDSENQHFLYSILAQASFLVFGDSAWSLRLPAVLFGIASIWAMYLLGREAASSREGLLAAALLTFSYTHIWFSQNARGYSGLLFWTTFSSWLLLRALRENTPRLWIFFAIAAALGVYTHITMVFVIAGQFFVYAWTLIARRNARWENRWAGFVLGFCGAGLLTLFLHALVLPQLLGGMGREASVVAEWKNPLWTIIEIARGLQVSFAGGIVALGALVVFGAGIASFARSKPEIILLLILPPIIGAAVVVGLGHHLWPRFFFFAMGLGALVAMRGAMAWGRFAARIVRLTWLPAERAGTLVCLALIAVSALSVPLAYGPKQDYAGAMQFVEANRQPGDAIVITDLTVFPYKNYYRRDYHVVENARALDSLRAHSKRTWLLYTFPPVLESVHPDVFASVQRDFQIIKAFGGTVGGGTIFVTRADAK